MKIPSTKDTIGCATEVKQPKTYNERLAKQITDKLEESTEYMNNKIRNERR